MDCNLFANYITPVFRQAYFYQFKAMLHRIYRGDLLMNSLELTAAVTAVSNAIACSLSTTELALVASLFVQLGDTLATIAAQRALCEERTERYEE